MPNFKLAHRPSPVELAEKYGLSDSSLLDLCNLDGHVPEPAKVVDFFLQAKTPYERKAFEFLKPALELETSRKIVFAGYEWVTFSLPGGNYKPDWSFLLDNGRWARVEIKASKMQPGYKDARSKLRAAAALNPWDLFYEFRMRTKAEGGGWFLEFIKPDLAWVSSLQVAFELWTADNGIKS